MEPFLTGIRLLNLQLALALVDVEGDGVKQVILQCDNRLNETYEADNRMYFLFLVASIVRHAPARKDSKDDLHSMGCPIEGLFQFELAINRRL